MGIIVTGTVTERRDSVNKENGEVTAYLRIADFAQDLQVTCRDLGYCQGIQKGAQVQVPVSARASNYGGAASIRWSVEGQIKQLQAAPSR